jgi:hypothetical protein
LQLTIQRKPYQVKSHEKLSCLSWLILFSWELKFIGSTWFERVFSL